VTGLNAAWKTDTGTTRRTLSHVGSVAARTAGKRSIWSDVYPESRLHMQNGQTPPARRLASIPPIRRFSRRRLEPARMSTAPDQANGPEETRDQLNRPRRIASDGISTKPVFTTASGSVPGCRTARRPTIRIATAGAPEPAPLPTDPLHINTQACPAERARSRSRVPACRHSPCRDSPLRRWYTGNFDTLRPLVYPNDGVPIGSRCCSCRRPSTILPMRLFPGRLQDHGRRTAADRDIGVRLRTWQQ